LTELKKSYQHLQPEDKFRKAPEWLQKTCS